MIKLSEAKIRNADRTKCINREICSQGFEQSRRIFGSEEIGSLFVIFCFLIFDIIFRGT